jgi:hypothetical protein
VSKKAKTILAVLFFGALVLVVRTELARAKDAPIERKMTLLCGDEATWTPAEDHKDVWVKAKDSECKVKIEVKCSAGQATPQSEDVKPENSKRFKCPAEKHVTEVKATCTPSETDKNCVVEIVQEH